MGIPVEILVSQKYLNDNRNSFIPKEGEIVELYGQEAYVNDCIESGFVQRVQPGPQEAPNTAPSETTEEVLDGTLEEAVESLEQISGVGPATAKRFYETYGVVDLEGFLSLDPELVSRDLSTTKFRFIQWQEAARELLGKDTESEE